MYPFSIINTYYTDIPCCNVVVVVVDLSKLQFTRLAVLHLNKFASYNFPLGQVKVTSALLKQRKNLLQLPGTGFKSMLESQAEDIKVKSLVNNWVDCFYKQKIINYTNSLPFLSKYAIRIDHRHASK